MSASLMGAFVAEVAVITYREFAQGIQVPQTAPISLPLPAVYTAPVLVYGALALVPEGGAHVAGLIGWGLVVATLLNLWSPSTGKVNNPNVNVGPATQPAKKK